MLLFNYMRIIASIFFVLFILSIIGIAFFPSSVMILCSVKNICHLSSHQIDKAMSLFNAVFSTLILIIVSLVLVFVIPSINLSNIRLTRLFRTPHDTLFDYLKRALSQGIIEPQLYN